MGRVLHVFCQTRVVGIAHVGCCKCLLTGCEKVVEIGCWYGDVSVVGGYVRVCMADTSWNSVGGGVVQGCFEVV